MAGSILRRCSFLLLAVPIGIMAFAGCTKRTCKDPDVYFSLQGWDSTSIRIIHVKEYQPGTGFGVLVNERIMGTSVPENSVDSIPLRNTGSYSIYFSQTRVLNDLIIDFPDGHPSVQFSNFSMEEVRESHGWGDHPENCSNRVVYNQGTETYNSRGSAQAADYPGPVVIRIPR